ncbi:MAG TPA: hypothetical protein PJ995_21095 [Cyclobacteriaceae bacterium]|nr:hypothetical protein [Cyclobacteriaceae bacterium]HNA14708.1 hypothetical protein [Cyclobacteriaceae bacterium]
MADVTKTTLIKVEVEGIQQATTQTEKLTKEIDKQEVSIANLREENKKLTKQRNEVDISSKEGQDKLRALNDQLDANNKKIKENVDAYTKQKIGIGDYKGALDKLVPGLGATADGISGMTKSSLAFIATPIGAVIGAIGIALVALTSYFKSTGEGQDKLTEIMKVGGVVMEGVKRVVEFVGKAIFAYVEFVAGAWKKIVDFILPSVGKAIDGAIEDGKKIAALDDEIDAQETAMVERRAQVQNEVARLRAAALTQEGEQRKQTIEKAIQLEKDLSAAEVDLAQKRLKLWDMEHANKKDLIDEEKRQRAELSAAVIAADTEAYSNTLRFEKEIERIRDENHKNELKRMEERAAAKRAESDNFTQQLYQETEIQNQEVNVRELASLTSIEKMRASAEASRKAQEAASKKTMEAAIKDQQTQTKISELEQKNRLMSISTGLGQAQALFAQDTAAHKVIGISRATIDTYVAANAAFAAAGGWPLGVLAAAVTVATGLANVAKIMGFAEGGFTGEGGKHEVAGVVHRGEYVVPQHIVKNPAYSGYIMGLESARMRGYADGGLVTNTATNDANQMAQMSEMFKNINFWVSWKEGNEMGNSVHFKEKLSTI